MTRNYQHEERVQRLHQESIILLAHDHVFPPQDLEDLRRGGVTAKILMAVLDARAWAPDPADYQTSTTELDGWFSHAREVYGDLLKRIRTSASFTLVRKARDVLRAKAEGKIGILFGAEGGKIIEDRLENLHHLYELGLRHVMLTWAFNNRLSTAEGDRSNAGLTEFGRQVVYEMNRLGMLVDITHLSRPAMRDVLTISSRPVLNSHTALKSVSQRVPAVTEEEIRAVADKGGVIALHFMTHMLTGRFEPRATLDDVLRQIDAIVRVGGIDCLALGPDYLPYTEDFRRNTEQWQLTFPVGLESPAGMVNLIRGLVDDGYGDEAIQKILGGNLLRLLRDTLG